MPRRSPRLAWFGWIVAVAAVAALAAYLWVAGLHLAVQLAAPIGVVVALAALFAQYLPHDRQPSTAELTQADPSAGTVGAPSLTFYAIAPIAAPPASALAQAVGGMTVNIPGQSLVQSAAAGSPVNQTGVLNQLTSALDANRSNVILVYGEPGVGKSTLVSWALDNSSLGEKVFRYNLSPGGRLDAKTVLDAIEFRTSSERELRPGEDVLSRLEAAMEAPAGDPVTIVVDGAQHLLEPEARTLISLQLDEALDVIVGRRRRIKLILVVREVPTALAGSRWLRIAAHVPVSGLPREHFQAYLDGLDPVGEVGLAALMRADDGALYEALQGIPRLAELFCAALALPHNKRSAGGLAALLTQSPPEERERVLAREVVDSLGADQRRIVVALAAYATPVSIELVSELLADELPAGRAAALLPELVDRHVIGKTPMDKYYVPALPIHDALMRLPDGPARLLHDAANLLSRCREPEESIERPEDLDGHFAELEVRVRAQLWASSYELINEIDRLLRRWSAAGLLLKYREVIAGMLRVSFREMVNYNALGCIYMTRGRFGPAQRAFDNALRHADATTWPHGRRKIYLNLAALQWDDDDTCAADDYYRKALAMAEEHDDALDRMTAEAGLADCFRRWGDFAQAVSYCTRALSIAQAEDSPWAVGLAVKLARWHSELDERARASDLIDVADRAAAEHPDPALRAQCLDGRADLLLDAGDFGRAKDVARQALTEALLVHDPVTVLQARTTMAMAYLQLDDITAARREINRAARYRHKGRSLVVLALQALIAFRADPDGRARELFADLEREAVGRRERDERDFAAWDFEGLAVCGVRVGTDSSLDPAIAAFRRAREQAGAPPGLEARLRFWLGILQAKALPGQMAPVVAAASSPLARSRRP